MATDKVDFKKTLKHLYRPSAKAFSIVDVPQMQFIKVDGRGAPGNDAYVDAVSWLYATSYPIKFMAKIDLGRDYVVPPLEGLWWADDMDAFVNDHRDQWQWTMMIMQPEWITADIYEAGKEKAITKLGPASESLRFETYDEGHAVQILHLGPYSDEGPTIAKLHNEFLPENDLTETGHHHEIYISDPRRVAPEKMKTVLRQPVRDA